MSFGSKKHIASSILVAVLFFASTPAQSKPKVVADWMAPDGRTFHLALWRPYVSGFSPEPVAPVVLDGDDIIALGAWSYAAIVRCDHSSQCGVLLSTWLPVRAEPDPSSFAFKPPDAYAERGFKYKAMSASDWLAVFQNFMTRCPVMFWGIFSAGVLGAALSVSTDLIRRRFPARSTLTATFEFIGGTVWAIGLGGVVVSNLLFILAGPSWFYFLPLCFALAVPYGAMLLLRRLRRIGGTVAT